MLGTIVVRARPSKNFAPSGKPYSVMTGERLTAAQNRIANEILRGSSARCIRGPARTVIDISSVTRIPRITVSALVRKNHHSNCAQTQRQRSGEGLDPEQSKRMVRSILHVCEPCKSTDCRWTHDEPVCFLENYCNRISSSNPSRQHLNWNWPIASLEFTNVLH